MKCYDFELNISTYIEGELKQSLHSSFKEHRENCFKCNNKNCSVTKSSNTLTYDYTKKVCLVN